MPAVPWTTEAQRAFAKKNLLVYDTAVKDGKKAIRRFFSAFTSEFLETFPLKDELVNSGALGQHVLAENYDLTDEETETFQRAMENRTKQIKTLFRYLHKKEYEPAPAKVSADSKSHLTTAAKVFVTKQRRCHHRSETFYMLNKDWLDRMIEQEMEAALGGGEAGDLLDDDEEDGGGVGDDAENDAEEGLKVKLAKDNKAEAKSRGWNLKIRNAVIKRHYDLASEDDQRAVSEAIIQEKEELERAGDLDRSGRALARDPKLREEALEKVNAFLVENARLYWDYAAMTTITVGVAPDPDHPEKLRSRVVAYGRDVNGKIITDIDPTLAGRIVKQLRTWSKTHLFAPEHFKAATAEHQERLRKLDGGSEADDDAPDVVEHDEKTPDVIVLDEDTPDVIVLDDAAKKSPAANTTRPPAATAPKTKPNAGRSVKPNVTPLPVVTPPSVPPRTSSASAPSAIKGPTKSAPVGQARASMNVKPLPVHGGAKEKPAQDKLDEDEDDEDDEDEDDQNDEPTAVKTNPNPTVVHKKAREVPSHQPSPSVEASIPPSKAPTNVVSPAVESPVPPPKAPTNVVSPAVESPVPPPNVPTNVVIPVKTSPNKHPREDPGAEDEADEDDMDQDPQYHDIELSFGGPTNQDVDGFDDAKDDSSDGEGNHDAPFDGAAFWANLDTNIPDGGKAKEKPTVQASEPIELPDVVEETGRGKSKGRGKGKKGGGRGRKATKPAEAAKAAKAATSDTPAAQDIAHTSEPAAAADDTASSVPGTRPSPDASPADSDLETGKKRKAPPIVPEVEEGGRPKRKRGTKTLDDGTVYAPPTRQTRAITSKATADKATVGKGGKGVQAAAVKSTGKKGKGK